MKTNLKSFPNGHNKSDLSYIADMVKWKRAFKAEQMKEDLDYMSKQAGIALQQEKHVMFGIVNSYTCGFFAGYRFAKREVLGEGGAAPEMRARFPCFGNANCSDACMQCPDNAECANLTVFRYKKRRRAARND